MPSRVDRFLVLGPLGQGGMSSVHRAYDPKLDRQVAIKVMLPGRHEGRVVREAQALARMSHPNVVQVYEVGEADDRLFIAMELVAGQSLRQWQRDDHPWRRCLEIYTQAGRGLAAAHAAGLIHRDFKPANCILDEQGRVRVLDFGLARHEEGGEADEEEHTSEGSLEGEHDADEASPIPRSTALHDNLTQTNAIVGTKAYMAPEQLIGARVDARCDQFSFCVSFYEALCGQRPFTANPMEKLLKMAMGEPVEPAPPPADRRVPRWLVRILGRGLSAHPDERWPSMDALLAQLERHQRRQRARWAGWGVAAVGVAWAVSLRSTPQSAPSTCERAGQAVTALWSDERRARIGAAMDTTGLPYAQELWAKVKPRLGRYVDDLAAARVAACTFDTESHHAQRRCLDTLGSTLHRTLSLLEEADPHTTERASDLVEGLPEVQDCIALGLEQDAEPARTPEQEQHVSTLRGRLQVARALERAAKLEQAREEVESVVEQAEALSDPAFLAESHLARGFVLLADDDIEQAQRSLKIAYESAVELGLGRLEVEAATSLAYLVGVDQAQSDAGRWLASTAESLARRHDPEGMLEAEALTVSAQVLAQRGQLDESELRYRDALDVLTPLGDHAGRSRVVALNGLGQVLQRLGKHEQAQDHYERALELRISALGERHPEIAYQRTNLGVVLMERDRLDDAEDQFERAQRILEPLPSQGKLLAQLHSNLGILRKRQGRAEEGARHLRRAIEAWETAYGTEHPWVAQTRMNLGANLERRERYEPAAEQYRLALQIIEANDPTPTNDELRFRLLRSLAEVHNRQQLLDEAERYYRQALEVPRRRGRARGLQSARLHNRLGKLYSAQRRFDRATSEHEAALQILEASAEPPFRTFDTLLLASEAAYATERSSDALAWVERALAMEADLPEDQRASRIARAQRLRDRLSGDTKPAPSPGRPPTP